MAVLEMMALAEDSKNEAELKAIYAREILDKIQKGEDIELDGYSIIGDLDLSHLQKDEKNRGIVASQIDLRNCIFKGGLNFTLLNFKKTIDFSGTHFEGYAVFTRTEFSGDAFFMGSHFEGTHASFTMSQFSGDANFYKSQFNGIASFNEAQFNGYARFIDSQFGRDANFSSSKFSGEADFIGSRFSGATYFIGSRFSGTAYFGSSIFDGITSFESSTFDGEAIITYCNFNNYSSFNNCKFNKEANFRASIFKDTLELKDIEFERIYFDWDEIEKAKRDLDGEVYLSLIESYKSRGFFEDADNCYYIYRMERRCKLPTPYKPFDWILWASYGYGVKPIRPLIWTLAVFILFTLLYATVPGAIGITKAFSLIDALNTSSTILLSGTQLIATPDYPSSGLLAYWTFTLEKLLGSLFLALLLVSIGRTIIR